MSTQRLFTVGETLAWDFRFEDSCYLRSMIREGNLPEVPVAVEVRETVRERCPVCGSSDLYLRHESWRIDGSPDGCEWDGTWPHMQEVCLQNGTWMSGDWFK